MSIAFIGQVRMFGGNFAPTGHVFCDGRLLQIAEYETLYTLIGTTYGGDGVQTFAVPDLRGRAPVHLGLARSGTRYVQGQIAGSETVTLQQSQMPSHSHPFTATATAASSPTPASNIPATPSTVQMYDTAVPVTPAVPMSNSAITNSGNSLPHDNMQPYLAISFIIATVGVFPSSN